MRRLCRVMWCCAVALAMCYGPAVYGQQSEPPTQATAAVKATGEEVLLDVVVRDKKGRAVDDLKPESFQVFENGEPKKITSFRLVRGAEAIGTGGTRTQLDPLRQIRLVTMIFHCSDPNAQRLARDSALDLLKGELPQNVYMAIMTIDFKLEVLQPFTNDTALLRQAIDRATRGQSADFSKDTETVRRQLEQMLGPNTGGAQSLQEQVNNATPTVTGNRPPANPGAFANAAMAQMLLEMIQTEQSYAMTQSGRTAVYALLDAVKEQYRLPGRKTILYFSEGFVVPQELDQPFRQTLSIANRSNVSFYTVDAHGLMATSANRAANDTLRAAVQSSRDQATTVSGAVRADEANAIDTAIASTRANTQTALAELAESTGGTLIANTNDLRGPLRKLAEDIQTYYELSYNPEIKTYDGSFRKITVKVTPSDLLVQSRSGYLALPPALAKGGVLRAFEVPLLTALDSPEVPKSFAYEATAMHFRGKQGQPVCDLVVDVPLAGITFQKSKSAGQFDGRLSYVALLKDAQHQVVKKYAHDVPLSVPAAKLDGLKSSHFIYTEHFDLPPGPYTLETAVLDGEGNRISGRKSSLTMPPPSTALAISSVAAVRNTKEREKSTADDDPFLVGSKLISPTLDPVVSKVNTPNLPFYVVIYSDKSVSTPPQLVMQFSRNGKVLGNGLPPLGPPDAEGRIQYVALTPLSRLEPGDFSIRFIAKQGSETAEETVSFTVQ